MSSNQNRDDDRPWRRMIQQRQERVEDLLNELNRRSAYVELTPEMKRELAAAIADLHRMLTKYRDDPVYGDAALPDISPIVERLGEMTTIMSESNRRGDDMTYNRVPAVDELSFGYLKQTANQVQTSAKSLGFWANLSATESGGSSMPNPSKLNPDGPEAPAGEERQKAADFEQSHFFRSLYKDVEGARGGGAIVIVDAEDARTGVGKTGAACAMAEFVAWYFGYELREADGVLSGQEYLQLFQDHPNEEQVSVAVWDEAVGAGSGDARRAMAQENVDLGRAWQIMRDRRVITFVTLPDWGDLDSRLQKLADYRVWCRRDIGSLQAYEIGTTFEGGDIRTRGLGPGEGAEPISFPDVTEDSDLYQAIKAKKDKVQESDSLDAGDLVDDDDDAGEQADTGPDLKSIADEVAGDIGEYTSVNSTNKTEYIDADLIQMEYELSVRDARKVKKLVERREGSP
jgi:hypothetical protein